jgi:hypothetical protein
MIICASISKVEELTQENCPMNYASPIDLAVALESACWDLDFLV